MLTFQQIQQTVAAYFKDKPVKRVYLFGSYARGEANENSDIDLLVDVAHNKGVGLGFLMWHADLEQKLKTHVDVIPNAEKPEHTSNWALILRINQEKKLLLYEKGS